LTLQTLVTKISGAENYKTPDIGVCLFGQNLSTSANLYHFNKMELGYPYSVTSFVIPVKTGIQDVYAVQNLTGYPLSRVWRGGESAFFIAAMPFFEKVPL